MFKPVGNERGIQNIVVINDPQKGLIVGFQYETGNMAFIQYEDEEYYMEVVR